MIPAFLAPAEQAIAPALKNHLWQSTLFALLAALLALALRSNRARERYWLWMAASLKFLLPFALLAGIGSHFARPRAAATVQPRVYFAVEDFSEPFAPQFAPMATPLAAPAAPVNWAALLPALCAVVWLAGFVTVLVVWCVRWRRIAQSMREAVPLTAPPFEASRVLERLRRIEQAAGLRNRKKIELRVSSSSMEPGVFGIAYPVLAWPAGISQRLNDAQLDAILAHEVCHVRRRDNLTAAIHMLVEAVFWFHPLVWWLGARLLEERERACDEEVLRLCNRPEVYAESILKVCEFCLESPLPCVSGVTGSDLKRRIGSILAGRIALKLGPGRKLLLLAAALLTIAVPILLGQAKAAQRMAFAAIKSAPSPLRAVAHAMLAEEQTPSTGLIANEAAGGQDAGGAGTDGQEPEPVFEVASIRPSAPDPVMMRWQQTPDGLIVNAQTLKTLITYAYGILPEYVLGGPDWTGSEQFDINAKFGDKEIETLAKLPPKQRDERAKAMLRNLLVERFKLKVRQETKESAIYSLVVAQGGPKLMKSPPLVADSDGNMPPEGGRSTGYPNGRLVMKRYSMLMFARTLSDDPEVAREVVDGTGLKGPYDFEYTWKPSQDGSGPSLFTALQEQLGLKLEATKGPVETLVIESAEKPSVDGAEVPQLAAPSSVATTPASATAAAPATSKSWTFEVVSIRRNMSAPGTERQSYGPTPDGYRMRDLFMEMPILTAYVPQSGGRTSYIPARVVGLPDWANNDAYDIDAKVAEADLADWQNPAKQPAMLRAMLQAMLQNRLKMIVHREMKEAPVYSLVVDKNGPKLKETNPNEPHPGGFPIPGGGVVVSKVQNREIITNWYGVSMATVASLGVLGNADRQVQDKTGLTGRYDIAFEPRQLRTCAPNCGPQDAAPEKDTGPSVFEFVQELGLRLVPAKGPVETLVIDQIERPSPN